MRPVLYKKHTEKIEALKNELRKLHGEDIGIHEDSNQQIWLIQFIGKDILRRGQTVSAAMTVLIEDTHENHVKVAVGMARWNLKADNEAMSLIFKSKDKTLAKAIKSSLEKK